MLYTFSQTFRIFKKFLVFQNRVYSVNNSQNNQADAIEQKNTSQGDKQAGLQEQKPIEKGKDGRY